MAREPSIVSPSTAPEPPVEQTPEERRAEGQRIVREREAELQRERDEQVRLAAEEAQKPANKMRRWLGLLRSARGVDDQRNVHHLVLSEMLQHMLSNVPLEDAPVEPAKEPVNGK